MTKEKCLLPIVLILFVSMLQGCATSDKSLSVKNFEAVPQIKVVRFESPHLKKTSVASDSAAMTGMMFGALGGALGSAIQAGIESKGGKSLEANCNLPDFGKLVMDGLTERLPAELPRFPELAVADGPESSGFKNTSGYALVVQVKSLAVRNGAGLVAITTAKMVDSSNQVVWLKNFTYSAKDLGRCCNLKELEADGGKLFQEEYLFAANETVSSFLDHLKGGQPA